MEARRGSRHHYDVLSQVMFLPKQLGAESPGSSGVDAVSEFSRRVANREEFFLNPELWQFAFERIGEAGQWIAGRLSRQW
jgi:hypothetical protein